MNDDPRFWLLDFTPEDHTNDLLRTIADEEIVCIVDEDAGGIIAYVLGGWDYAMELLEGLNRE